MLNHPLYKSDKKRCPIEIKVTEDEGVFWLSVSIVEVAMHTGLSMEEAKEKAIKTLRDFREECELAVGVVSRAEEK